MDSLFLWQPVCASAAIMHLQALEPILEHWTLTVSQVCSSVASPL